MPRADLEVLYEDNHLLAINKPAGLPTMGVAADLPSLFTLAKQYTKRRYQKPGNVYLGIVSRLDAASSGVVLFARTSKAAARLTEQFRARAVQKIYWAIVSGDLEPGGGELVDWLVKDEAHQRMAITRATHPAAKEARLTYRRLGRIDRGTILEVTLLTGRKHQIRLQLASRGRVIWGEKKYGQGAPFGEGIALHARRLTVVHPVTKEALELTAPLPRAWRRLGIAEEADAGRSAP